jgi:hypothetical protein
MLIPLLAVLALPPLAGDQTRPGAAVVVGAPDECVRAEAVQVWSITRDPAVPPAGPAEVFRLNTWLRADGGPLSVYLVFVTGEKATGECRWTFSGLPPGDYVALLLSSRGSWGSQSFSVQSGDSTAVAIPAPEVTLTGRVSRNGTSPGQTNVRVTGFPFSRPAVTTVTDSDGLYAVTLDRAGLYRIEANRIGAVEAALADGSNVVDIAGP